MLLIAYLALIIGSVFAQYGNQDDNCCEEYCYVKDEDPYLYFSTKTAYESVNSRRSNQQHIVPGRKIVINRFLWKIS